MLILGRSLNSEVDVRMLYPKKTIANCYSKASLDKVVGDHHLSVYFLNQQALVLWHKSNLNW